MQNNQCHREIYHASGDIDERRDRMGSSPVEKKSIWVIRFQQNRGAKRRKPRSFELRSPTPATRQSMNRRLDIPVRLVSDGQECPSYP